MKQEQVSRPIDTGGNLINSYREAYDEAGMMGIAVFLHENIKLMENLHLDEHAYDKVLEQELACLTTAYMQCLFKELRRANTELPFPEVCDGE